MSLYLDIVVVKFFKYDYALTIVTEGFEVKLKLLLSVATVITMLPSMALATDASGDASGTLTPAALETAEGRIDFGAPSSGGILEVKDGSGAVYKAYTDKEGKSYVQGP